MTLSGMGKNNLKNWEETDGTKVDYCYVSKTGFMVGAHHGSGHTDNAIHYTITQMLDPLQMYYEPTEVVKEEVVVKTKEETPKNKEQLKAEWNDLKAKEKEAKAAAKAEAKKKKDEAKGAKAKK